MLDPRKSLLIIATLALSAGMLAAGETSRVGVVIHTRDGSRLHALVDDTPLPFKTAKGQTVHLPWNDVARVSLARRGDRALEDQARKHLDDLQSTEFKTREKALAELKALGAAAVPVLRKAVNHADAEVASKARMLLGQAGQMEFERADDLVARGDKTEQTGQLEGEGLDALTAWGKVRLTWRAVQDFEVLDAERTKALADSMPRAAPVTATIGDDAADAALPAVLAKRFSPYDQEDEFAAGLLGVHRGAALNTMFGLRMATFDSAPGKEKTQAGDEAGEAYAPWGMHLKTAAPFKVVFTGDEAIVGFSQGLALSTTHDNACGDLDITFSCAPRAGEKDRTPGGVHAVGFSIGKAPAGAIALEAYDRDGNLLIRALNEQEGNVIAGGGMRADYLGVRTALPIAHVKIKRLVPAASLRIDDLLIDQVVDLRQNPGQARVLTTGGDVLIGALRPSHKSDRALTLRPAFATDAALRLEVPFDAIRGFFSPRPLQDLDKVKPRTGAKHAVLLQNGEGFRAELKTLEGAQVTFALPGGAELTLPKKLLRKIDLWPDHPKMDDPEAGLPKIGKDEKPGVTFRQPGRLRELAGEVAPDEPKKEEEGPKPTEGLPNMDNAEILKVNAKDNELVVDPKDGGGAWPIDLWGARFLVFPEDKDAAQAARAERPWRLFLQQGSSIRVKLTALDEKDVKAELAGGTITLPHEVVDHLIRDAAAPEALEE